MKKHSQACLSHPPKNAQKNALKRVQLEHGLGQNINVPKAIDLLAVHFSQAVSRLTVNAAMQSICRIQRKQNTTQEIENYKIKSDIYKSDLAEYERLVKLKNEKIQIQQDRAVTLFKDIIITGLLPTFTAVLGYIFGSASIENRD